MIRTLVAAASALVLLAHGACKAALPPLPSPIRIDVVEREQPSGSSSVTIRALISGVSVSVFTPAGMEISTNSPGREIGFGDLDAALLAAAGEWRIVQGAFAGRPAEEHRFSLADTDPSSLVVGTPEIVTPVDGSVVPPDFAIDWDYPAPPNSPATGPSVEARYNGNAMISFQFVGVPDSTSALAHATIAPDTLQVMNLRAGAFQSLQTSVPAVYQGAGMPNYAFSVTFGYTHLSAPVRVTIAVPEPGGVALALASLALHGARRRVAG